jgi:septal ring factor EnvC (AmiA/AmiB activator)
VKLTKQDIVLVIIALLCLYNIFNTNSIKTDVNGYKDKIEALQTKVDSAQAVNEKIDIKIDSVKDNVVNITKEIHHIDNNISIIKQQTNEKVNIVDTYTASELEQFFTDRYNESKNK